MCYKSAKYFLSVKKYALVYNYRVIVYFVLAGDYLEVPLNIENNKHTLTTKNITTMKTTILTIAIFFATAFGISQSFAATTNGQQVSTVLTGVTTINEIEIHGNVQLYVSDGTTDKVKVYNNYYAENALVQDENGVLRITSYNTQKLVVWVTVSELSKISAFDNAQVKSFGKLSSIDLDVKLFDRASAQLDMDAYSASITLNDRTEANLTGKIDAAKVSLTPSSFINTKNLVAARLETTVKMHRMPHFHDTEFASL